MSKNVLRMKYHAAKKEISFKRFQDDEEIAIKAGGALSKYVNMKGKFILQDFGNTFFKDIARVFDGISNVNIEAIMTKLDYEDFEQMVENYNQEPDKECTFHPTLFAELPDMKKTYEEVRKFGENACRILNTHRNRLYDICLDNENVKFSVESFAQQINEEVKNIENKITSLRDNHVSLCFTGVYSAGKSALINAILGYRILPESIKSETAKMFRIYSPEKNGNEKIIFMIDDVYTELQWNELGKIFEFKKGPSENSIRQNIQCLLNEGKKSNQSKDEQLLTILKNLNKSKEVSNEIRIEFPIPLDREDVQFTIYDTPGTDSNYSEHQNVLTEALENQTQSILIFVAKPDGLEGEGNNALLSYLKKAENKHSKTSIDIGRSLFVINKADSIDSEARKTLQFEQIKDKEDDSFTIKLEDKKLFFTSAKYGYYARAAKNGNESAKAKLKQGNDRLATPDSDEAYCFKENRCATSEVSTKRMLARCEAALEKAESEENDADILEICSGMYALESEILQYGEKYAAAVKAFAIIDSVDKALAKMTTQAYSLRDSNNQKIAEIEENIRQLRSTINNAIEKEYQARTIPTQEFFPEETRRRLKIDSSTLKKSLLDKTVFSLDKMLKGSFFGLGKVKFKETDKTKIKDKISGIISDFTNEFMDEREKLLTEERDSFISAVQKAIMDNGKISDSAKKFFQDIPRPNISRRNIMNLDGIYNSNKRVERGLFGNVKERLDKEAFIDAIKDNLQSMATDMTNDYAVDYQNALETILMAIKGNFECNLENYSKLMQAMIANREVMKELGNKIEYAANELEKCEDSLNKIIWKEK